MGGSGDPNWIGRLCAQGKALIPNVLTNTVTFAAATTGAVAIKRLFTVNGVVAITAFGICSTNVAGTGSIQLGHTGATDGFIAVTAGTDLDADELWTDATPTTSYDIISDTVPLWRIVSNDHILYEVTVGTLTSGVITFYCIWEPISEGAMVQSAGVNAAA